MSYNIYVFYKANILVSCYIILFVLESLITFFISYNHVTCDCDITTVYVWTCLYWLYLGSHMAAARLTHLYNNLGLGFSVMSHVTMNDVVEWYWKVCEQYVNMVNAFEDW